MARTKQASKRNRRSKAVPVLGAAGLSLSRRAERPHQRVGRRRMSHRKTPLRITKSFSARRKSRT